MTSLASVFVEVRPDASGFSSELKTTLAKTREAVSVAATLDTKALRPQLDALKAELKSVSLTRATITADSAQMSAKIRELKLELKGLNDTVKIGGRTDELTAKIAAIKAEIGSLTGGKARLSIDSAQASARLKLLQAQLGVFGATRETARVEVEEKGVNFAFRGISNLTTAIVGLAPVAVPALATVAAGVGVLGSSLLTAGAAGGVFAGAVAGQIAAMKKQQDAIKAVAKTRDSAKQGEFVYKAALDATTKGTAAHAAALKAYQGAQAKTAEQQRRLNDATRGFNKEFGPAAKGLDNVKSAFSRFLQATRPVTVKVMGDAMNVVAGILPRLVPLANAAGRAVGGLVKDVGHFAKSQEFKNLLATFQTYGPAAIRTFGKVAGNILLGVVRIFESFLPYTGAFNRNLLDMSRNFSKWSAGFGSSGGFQKFMAYAKQVLPEVRDLFLNLTQFVGKFIVALGPLAGIELKLLTDLLRGLNNLPPKALTAIAVAITGIVLGLKAWELGTKAVTVVSKTAQAITALFIGTMNTETGVRNASILATVRQRVAIIATTVASKAAAVASKVWAAGQWLLNAALTANPIGIVVVAIAALVAGFVVAYKTSATFRNIVSGAWSAIKTAVAKAWTGIKVALSAFAGFLTRDLMPAINALRDKVVLPVFKAISTAIKVAWVVIRLVFQLWRAYMLLVLFPAITALWTRVVKPVMGWVGQGIKWAWSNIIQPVFNAWSAYFKNVLFPVIKFLWTDVVKPVMGWVGGRIHDVWANVILPVFTALKDFVGTTLVSAFRNGVDAIGRIWNGLKNAALAPVRFIVNTVYDNGIRKVINAIPGVTDLPSLHFAQGGVMPGYTPGRDVHHFHSPTGGKLALSGGEAIMRPEFTRAVGGERGVKKINDLAKRGVYHFSGGGIFRPTSGGSYGSLHDQWTGFPAVDIRVGTGTPVHAIAPGRVTVSEDLATSYGHWIELAHSGFQSLYAHLQRRLVGLGAGVAGGQLIGYSDSTGNSTGPHLHFGVRGRSPLEFMHASTNYASGGSAPGGGGGLGGVLSSAWQHLQGIVGGLTGKLGGWVSHLNHMGPWGKMLTGAVKSMVGGVKDFATSKLSGALSALGNVASNGLGLNGGTVGQIVKGLAQRSGWGTGAEWSALSQIISHESGWNPKAQNPSSSAYGLFQFLDSTWATVGGHKTSNANLQTQYGLAYIAHRYGDPVNAWNHWQKYHSYDQGGVASGVGMMAKATSRPERVLSPRQTEAFDRLVAILERNSMGPTVHIGHINTRDDAAAAYAIRREQAKALALMGSR